MKKSKKVLLLAGIATVTIGATAILHNGYMQPTTLESQSFIQAYKHNPSNILDNVYKKDNMTILPFIFENSDQSITKDKIVSEFAAKKLTVTNISTGDKIGTGTQIQVRENSVTYTVVIYGDTNGDGQVDVFDAQECVDDFVNDGKNLKGAYKIAANVENTDNEVNVFDAQRTVDFFVGIENKLVVNEPTSIYETDNEAPVISVNGQVVTDTYNMPTIKVGNTYTEPTVTATDNVDGDITASIIKSGDTVNTNVAGTYRVIYSVSDTKGNRTMVTLIVTVEPRSSGGGDGGGSVTTPTLTNIELAANKINLKIPQSSSAIEDSDYTRVPVTFLDQNNKRMNLTENEVKAKLALGLPTIESLGSSSITEKIETKYYTNSDNKVEAIGFALPNVDAKIKGIGNIVFSIGSNTKNLPVEIDYTMPTSIPLDDTVAEDNAGKTDAGVYMVRKGADFVLGTIQVGRNVKPFTTDKMKNPTIEGGDGLTISYRYDAKGNLLVIGNLTDTTETYTVTINAKMEESANTINSEPKQIKAVEMPENAKVEFKNSSTNQIVSESNPQHLTTTGSGRRAIIQLITKQEEKIVSNVAMKNEIKITTTMKDCFDELFMGKQVDGEYGPEFAEITNNNEPIESIRIRTKSTIPSGTTIKVTLTFYEGFPTLETEASFDIIID